MSNKEVLEKIISALNEAIEDKDIIQMNSIIMYLSNNHSQDLNNILIYNDKIQRTSLPQKLNIKIDENSYYNKKDVNVSKNYTYEEEENVFSNREKNNINFSQKLNPNMNYQQGNTNLYVNQYDNQTSMNFQKYNQTQFNNPKVHSYGNQQNSQITNINDYNNPTSTKNNKTYLYQQSFIKDNSSRHNTNNTNFYDARNQDNINLKKDNYRSNNDQSNNERLNIENTTFNSTKNKPKTFYNPNYNNEFVEREIKNKNDNRFGYGQHTNIQVCPNNLNEINPNDLYNIVDNHSFMKVMKCKNRNDDQIFFSCSSYHEFNCRKCLSNYFQIKYENNLREILIDKCICPICKDNSNVEDSHSTIKNIFGEEKYRSISK